MKYTGTIKKARKPLRWAIVLAASLLLSLPAVVADDASTAPTPTAWTPPTNATAPPNDPPFPVKEGEAWPTNLLTIDGATGLVMSASFIGANLTDVTVTKVKPESAGFRLKDHNGYYIWLNQSSTSKGTVEFWHVPVVAGGMYTVSQAVNGVESAILAFLAGIEAPQGNAPQCYDSSRGWYDCDSNNQRAQPGGGSNSGNQNPNPGGGGGGGECPQTTYTYELLSTKILWTPLLMAHAPHAGFGTANAQWTTTKAWFASEFGQTSTIEGIARLDANDGGTLGIFQLMKWGYYNVYQHSFCQKTYVGKTMKTIEYRGQTWNFDLKGNSRDTDADDVTYFTHNGYGSVMFDFRYHSADDTVGSQASGMTLGKSGSTMYQIGASIPGWEYFSDIGARAVDGSGTMYTYSFPASVFKIDYLQGNQQGWSFCEPRWATCPE